MMATGTQTQTRGRPPDPLIPLRNRLLVAFYQDGNTLIATGKKFGISTGLVHSIIATHERQHGVVLLRHDHGRPRGGDMRPSLIAFYQDGNTLAATGKKYGISATRVHQIITEHEQRYGVVLRRHNHGRRAAT